MPITEHSTSQPVTPRCVARGVTPAALVAAGIDPKATLEEKEEADGTIFQVLPREAGSISSK